MSTSSQKIRKLILVFGCFGLTSRPFYLHAETLADAIALAYQSNPSLQQARAQLRGIDENYVDAVSGLRPSVTLQAEAAYQQQRYGAATINSSRSFNANPPTTLETNTSIGQIVFQQTLYSGGRISTQVRTAEAQIQAGRQGLRATEGDLLLNVINAYSSVRRDEAILAVWRASVEQFIHQLDEAQARLHAGDATQTDVEQARAQLELERASMDSAAQQLESSRTAYAVYVGQNPGTLAPEPELPGLPASIDAAFDVAEAKSPELTQAVISEAASRAAIATARAAYRPSIAFQASYGYTGDVTPIVDKNLERDLNASATITQPLFNGGLIQSNIRKSVEQNNSDRINIEVIRRQVVSNVASYWNQMITGEKNYKLQGLQTDAARAAYLGMGQEYRAGQRSTFDVLYAEEVLRDAQIAALTARQAAYLGEAGVLRYIGTLQVESLTVGIPTYNPAANTRRVVASGALPLEGLLLNIDALGAPGTGMKPMTAPPLAVAPQLRAAAAAVDDSAPMATQLPVQPIPGSSANYLQPQLRTLPSADPAGATVRPSSPAPVSPDSPTTPDATSTGKSSQADPIAALLAHMQAQMGDASSANS
jgi:outer membrane protein